MEAQSNNNETNTLKVHGSLLIAALFYGASYSIAQQIMPRLIAPEPFILLRVWISCAVFWSVHAFLPLEQRKALHIPTAREQGYDLLWTVWRGVYVGPKVSDADYKWWAGTIEKLSKTPEFAKEQEARGLYPFASFGEDFARHVKEDVARFRLLAVEAGLTK